MKAQVLKLDRFSALFSAPVIVAALGYFVDIYDLLLFGIVRIPSLVALGLSETAISRVGASILNCQMAGLLLGGILWGVLADKRGRLSVLFGSILTYSLANIACGLVQDTVTYKVLRFVAGVGLAGELGAGVTLVSEIVPARLRTYGTSLVAGIGVLGGIVAYFTVEWFDWRTAYFIGGGLGISLLLLRVSVVESGVFESQKNDQDPVRGNFFALFTNADRLQRYLKCIGLGVPTWFVIGVLATFSNEFGRALGIAEPISPGLSITWAYVGLFTGDLLSGFLSQWLQSRKKVVLTFLVFALMACSYYFYGGIQTATQLYVVTTLLGLGIGYWALFVTIGAEQFGTNLRATAATTVPNMVRGTVILMITLFTVFKNSFSVLNAGALVAGLCFLVGFYCILTIPETHNRDLDFLEK
ncbi:MFS transporter [Larkinella harenae]